MQAFFVFELIDGVAIGVSGDRCSFSGANFGRIYLFGRLLLIRLGRRVFGWSDHVRVVGRFEFTISEEVHLLPDRRLHRLELGLLDKLRERVYLFLVEQRDKVVAEATHL